MKDPRLYLLHISECIAKIERFTAGGVECFTVDSPVYDAVLRNLQTLSESCQRLPDEIKACHQDIPWQRIGGFRNVLVHDYLGGIDPAVVWSVVEAELPRLKTAVLAELGPTSGRLPHPA
jgi:uncharacterized protein with HEPN domain